MADPVFPLDDDDVLDRIKAVLNVASIDAGGNWPSIVADANRQAVQVMQEILTGIGFSPSQIRSWDRAADVQLSQALFFALIGGAVGDNYDLAAVREYDRRDELRKLTVLLVNGQPQYPGAVTAGAGRVASGRLSASDDIFCLPRRSRSNFGWW